MSRWKSIFQPLVLSIALFSGAAFSQDSTPTTLRAMPKWAQGDKASYQVQQVVKVREGGKEETRFLANGRLELEAIDSSADAVTLVWHRRMDNAELELVREPFGIRGNAGPEKLINNLVRDGLPVKVSLSLKAHRARIENRDELVLAVRRAMQSIGGDFAGNNTGRFRSQSPGEQSNREPTRAQLGIQQPLVKHNETSTAFGPRQAGALAAWYVRLVQTEIEDFLGAMGRDFTLESQPTAAALVRTYRPTGNDGVLLTLSNASTSTPAEDAAASEDEKLGEPAKVGLAGGSLLPIAYEAKIELDLMTGWPRRAAIVRSESESAAPDAKRTTQRRVYLRQSP